MACEHKHIKSVNCELFCMDCGAKIDAPKSEEKKPEPKRPVRKKTKAD